VVGKFVEFFGEGTKTLTVTDRATIANMAPEYGATMGFFPVDEKTVEYFEGTGRTREEIQAFEAYFRAQGLFGVPRPGQIDFSQVVQLDLGKVTPSLAGPKRPQDRIEIGKVASNFQTLFSKPNAENGFNKAPELLLTRHLVHRGGETTDAKVPASPPTPPAAPRSVMEMEGNKPTLAAAQHEAPAPVVQVEDITIGNGDVLIAAITSCTNTSNPGVLLAAGLLAKKAVEAGLRVKPHVKTSLAPGSRIVTEYLTKTGLLPYLEQLGFAVAGYGCTT
jgi:aconitate hydratase